jgi:feruloyl-CoA synthase
MSPADDLAAVSDAVTVLSDNGPEPLARLDEILGARIAGFNRNAGRSSRRIGRFLVMTEPPSIDAGEIADKGYVNQRATLERRAALVDVVVV